MVTMRCTKCQLTWVSKDIGLRHDHCNVCGSRAAAINKVLEQDPKTSFDKTLGGDPGTIEK